MYQVNKEKTQDLQWFYTLQEIVHNKTRTSEGEKSNTNKQKSIIKKYNPPPHVKLKWIARKINVINHNPFH